MRLYRVAYDEIDKGQTWKWFGTQAEAKGYCREIKDELGHSLAGKPVWERIDVPCVKHEFVHFMNVMAGDI
jgi:hypothetical protein